jgi:hypothetical protein
VRDSAVVDTLETRMRHFKEKGPEHLYLALLLFLNATAPVVEADIDQFVRLNPGAEFLNSPEILARTLIRMRTTRPRPRIVLPKDVEAPAPLAAPRSLAVDEAWADDARLQGQRLTEGAIAAARSLPTRTEQYYSLEEQVERWIHSEEPIEQIAGQQLEHYLHKQKARWAKRRIQELYTRPTSPEQKASLTWQMPNFLRTVAPGTNPTSDTIKASALPPLQSSWMPLAKVNRVRGMVERAWKQITDNVDPFVLNNVPPCYVVYNPNNPRAFHRGDFMMIGPNAEQHVVLHEFGHHLEDNLPPDVWYNILQLIEQRSGGEKKVGIHHPADWERGFVGEMPGTGLNRRYATRYYGGLGNSEVMATGLEALSDPTRAYELYLKDPQHFALVVATLQRSAVQA